MRTIATIKVFIKGIFSSWKEILLMYAVFPLLLSMAMGYFQKDSYEQDTNIKKININIIDEDNSKSSKEFKKIFETKKMKELFVISENGDYVITLPKGYEDNLLSLMDTTIKVNEKEKASRNRNNELIIKSLINEYGKEITEAIVISKKIQGLEIRDKESLYNEVINNINNFKIVSALNTNIEKSEKALTSYESQGAAMISYVVFMMIMGCIGGYHNDKENGSFKRIMSTPISRLSFFNLDLLIFFLTSFVYGVIYIITFRMVGFAFIGVNPFIIGSILIGQSLIITAFAGVMIAFLNKKNSNLILLSLLYFQIIFGGVFIPVKEITNKVFGILAKFAPGNLLVEVYRNSMLFNSFNKIVPYLISMFTVFLVLYIITIIKVKVRWEE